VLRIGHAGSPTAARLGYDGRMVEISPLRLSSRLTFFDKFIFPTVWSLGFAGGTLAMFMSRDPNNRGAAVGFAAATLIGTLFLSAVCLPLKTVIAAQDGIVVSNFVRQIEIPYHQIASVDENKWLSTRVTTIWLNADSAFGQKIRFQPYTQFTLGFWRDHPAVVLLRERVKLAQSTN
jgi:hypothetical protein